MSSTESPSPGTSTGSSSNQVPKKRTRASKPKVRTGCITWIRRVKCGEEKPACLRCSSTGRTCDGYDACLSPSRNRSAMDPVEHAELAKSEFLRACQDNEALRYMRPLAPDVDGYKMDKLFLRLPPVAASAGSTFHCTFVTFWNRVSSQHHGDDALRHALVALGAAHQLFGPSEVPLPEGFTPESLEVFAIQRYNMSISRLQPHISSSNPESVRITLICCLAFIFLETLRSNHAAAVTHFINGLRILESLPAPSFCYHYTGAEDFRPDIFSMVEVIDLFGSLESSACFFPTAIRPLIAEHGYRSRLFSDGSDELPFFSLADVHAALTHFQRDVMVRMSDISGQNPSLCPANATTQQSFLRTRSQRLDLLLSEFLSCAYLADPDISETDTLHLHLTLLHFRCSQLLLLHDTPAPPRHQDPSIHLDILRLAAQLQSCLPPPPRRRDSPLAYTDTPLAAPLYLVALDAAHDPPVRMQALRLLAEALIPGGSEAAVVRVARGLERVVSAAEGSPTLWSALGLAGRGGEGLVPCALTGLGCLPGVWRELAWLDGEE